METIMSDIGLEKFLKVEIFIQSVLVVLWAVFFVKVLLEKKHKIHVVSFVFSSFLVGLMGYALFEQTVFMWQELQEILKGNKPSVLFIKPPIWYLVHVVSIKTLYWLIRNEEDRHEERLGNTNGKPIYNKSIVVYLEKIFKKHLL